jgi:hypothetical protein
MKFKNCFIDEHGNIWRTQTLIEKSKDLKVVPYEIDAGALVDENIMWKLTNVRDYLVHYKRVQRADLCIPIILRSDGYIMDGWHRVIKAISCGTSTLPSRQFIVNPEPDFKEENKNG